MSDDPPDALAFYRTFSTRELHDLRRAFLLDLHNRPPNPETIAFIDLRIRAIETALAERDDNPDL